MFQVPPVYQNYSEKSINNMLDYIEKKARMGSACSNKAWRSFYSLNSSRASKVRITGAIMLKDQHQAWRKLMLEPQKGVMAGRLEKLRGNCMPDARNEGWLG